MGRAERLWRWCRRNPLPATLAAAVGAADILRERHARSSACTWLYFIQAGEDGPIKIGTSDDPVRRMGRMQVDNAAPLRFVAVCRVTRGAEADVHDDLARHRIRGEWFEPAQEVFVVAHAYVECSPIASWGRAA